MGAGFSSLYREIHYLYQGSLYRGLSVRKNEIEPQNIYFHEFFSKSLFYV